MTVLAALAAATVALTGVTSPYADAAFNTPLENGLHAFYQRDFGTARADFEAALAVAPDNTLAIGFLNATAAQTPGALDELIATEENRLTAGGDAYAHQLQLGFSYLFDAGAERGRDAEALAAFEAARAAAPERAGAHVGLGIMYENERSANRAKVELLAALDRDPTDVLAREYLALIYQIDLKDPQRGLGYAIDVPNVVPNYADIDFHIASLLHDLHQWQPAIAYATRGLELDVGHVGEAGQHGYTLLARIYLDAKRPADARRVLQASIDAGVDVQYAQDLLGKIR